MIPLIDGYVYYSPTCVKMSLLRFVHGRVRFVHNKKLTTHKGWPANVLFINRILPLITPLHIPYLYTYFKFFSFDSSNLFEGALHFGQGSVGLFETLTVLFTGAVFT